MGDKHPRATVLMPAHNAATYLRAAVDSILAQTLGDFELLLIDDGSTDRTAELARSYSDARLRFVQNDRNLGLLETLNRGLDLARGAYVARMDADDVALPTRLEKQIDFLEHHPDITVCGAWMDYLGQPELGEVRYPVNDSEIAARMLFANPVPHPLAMWRRQALADAGLRYEKYLRAQDYYFWSRTAAAGFKFHNLPEVLLHYRINAGGVTQSKHDEVERAVVGIQGEILARWGLQPDYYALRLHKAAGEMLGPVDAYDFAALGRHLQTLLAANIAKRLIEPESVRREVGRIWLSSYRRGTGSLLVRTFIYLRGPVVRLMPAGKFFAKASLTWWLSKLRAAIRLLRWIFRKVIKLAVSV